MEPLDMNTENVFRPSPEELAYGLMTAEFPGPELPEGFFKKPYGGVILFAKNIRSPRQLKELTGRIRSEAGGEILIGVDQEGGTVTRVSFPGMTPLCGNMAIGRTGSEDLAFRNGRICGWEIAELGFNCDFAPCSDVNSNPLNPIIGTRSFGESPELVAKMAAAFARGLEAGGVIACAKHFPGHGDTGVDSHLAMPVSQKTLKELEECELIPFMEVVRAGIPMIMTSHICFPKIDPGLPATLSKRILTGVLRERLGFDGVIITDSMAMKGIRNGFGYGEAAVRALEAGADMLIACGAESERDEAAKAIVNALKSGRLKEEALTESLLRTRRALAERRDAPPPEDGMETARETARRSIEVKRGGGLAGRRIPETLVVCPEKLRPSPHSAPSENPWLPELMGYADAELFDPETGACDDREIRRKAMKARRIVFMVSESGRLKGPQLKVAELLRPFGPKTVAMSANSPYVEEDLDWAAGYVNAFSGGRLSIESAVAAIDGLGCGGPESQEKI